MARVAMATGEEVGMAKVAPVARARAAAVGWVMGVVEKGMAARATAVG